MSQWYFEHAGTGRRYTIIKFDRELGTVTLKGEHAEFEEPFDKERFKRMGYELRKD